MKRLIGVTILIILGIILLHFVSCKTATEVGDKSNPMEIKNPEPKVFPTQDRHWDTTRNYRITYIIKTDTFYIMHIYNDSLVVIDTLFLINPKHQ